jgi:hypothetical protein
VPCNSPTGGRPNSCVTSRHFATGALLPNPHTKAGISVVKNAWRQGHTESVLFGRQLPGDRLVIVECRPSFRLPSASRLTGYCRICLGAPLEREWIDFKPLSNLLGLTLSSARSNAKERVNIGSVAMRCLRLVKNKICSADSMNKSRCPEIFASS